MKRARLVVASVCGLALTLVLLAAIAGPHEPAEAQGPCDRYVLGIDASDAGDCSDEHHPCRTIQYAIDQAVDGDAICVAKHTLAGPLVYPETLVVTKSVALDGAWDAMCVDPSDLTCSFTPIACDPRNVTIDAEGAGRVISISGRITPTIDCFTITGGDAAGLGGDPGNTVDNDAGGGIYSRDAAPIIVHNIITANYGCEACPVSYGRGGGIYLLNAPAAAVISDNLIARNVADESTWGQGGGVMLRDSDAQVLSNTIEHNRAGHSAGDGGGIAVRDGTPTLADNVISFNKAGQSVRGLGGGIYVWSASPTTIQRNELRYNQALHGSGDASLSSAGGGIYYASTTTTPVPAIIRDNVFKWNMAAVGGSRSGDGGGVYLRNLSDASILSGNVFQWNRGCDSCLGHGGGIYVAASETTIQNNEFSRNTATWAGSHGEGGGLYVDAGTVVIQSNTINGNTGAYFLGFPSSATGYGGGVAAVGGHTTLRDNSIAGNGGTNGEGLGAGGGIFGDSGTLQIEDNTVADNYGSIWDVGYGGGMAISGSLTLVQGNLITHNLATSDTAGSGGGIFIRSGIVQIAHNTIAANRATASNRGLGGGLYLDQSNPSLDSNLILDNVAAGGSEGLGGGVLIGRCPAFTVTNNIIARNGASEMGSGVLIGEGGAGTLAHNTIAENQGGVGVGIQVGPSSDAALINNVIVNHWQGIANSDPAGSVVTASHTLFEGNGSDYGAGVTSAQEIGGPAALLTDYHLDSMSNAIDQAPTLAWVVRDIDGDPRPFGAAADVGADEYLGGLLYVPLVVRGPSGP